MTEYKLIRTVLESFYGASVGRDEESAKKDFAEQLDYFTQYKIDLASELRSAFSDPSASWMRLFDEYDVCFFDTEIEARSFAEKILWSVVCPEEKIPEVNTRT